GAVAQWKAVGFGRLDYERAMRLVIPGITLTALGVQTILGGFFVSVLRLQRGKQRLPEDSAVYASHAKYDRIAFSHFLNEITHTFGRLRDQTRFVRAAIVN